MFKLLGQSALFALLIVWLSMSATQVSLPALLRIESFKTICKTVLYLYYNLGIGSILVLIPKRWVLQTGVLVLRIRVIVFIRTMDSTQRISQVSNSKITYRLFTIIINYIKEINIYLTKNLVSN